jgi:hypothetical protein
MNINKKLFEEKNPEFAKNQNQKKNLPANLSLKNILTNESLQKDALSTSKQFQHPFETDDRDPETKEFFKELQKKWGSKFPQFPAQQKEQEQQENVLGEQFVTDGFKDSLKTAEKILEDRNKKERIRTDNDLIAETDYGLNTEDDYSEYVDRPTIHVGDEGNGVDDDDDTAPALSQLLKPNTVGINPDETDFGGIEIINPETGKPYTKKELDDFFKGIETNAKGRSSAGGRSGTAKGTGKGRKRLTAEEKKARELQKIERHLNFVGNTSHSQKLLAQDLKPEETKVHIPVSASSAVNIHAHENMAAFIKRTPIYQITKQQIAIVNEEFSVYKKAGNKVCMDKCIQLIRQLKYSIIKYEQVFKNHTREEIDKYNALIKKDPEIKEINRELRDLAEILDTYSVSKTIRQLEFYRIALFSKYNNIKGVVNKDGVFDLDYNPDEDNEETYHLLDDDSIKYSSKMDDDEILAKTISLDDFEESPEEEDKSLEEVTAQLLKNIEVDNEIDKIKSSNEEKKKLNYTELLVKISNQLSSDTHKVSINDLELMSIKDIRELLKEATPNLEAVRERILLLKMDRSNKIKKIKGVGSITEIMFDLFNYNNSKDVSRAKEVLASSNITYVSAIAFKQCQKINKLNLYEDALSYGLLALAECLDKWAELQKVSKTDLSFEAFTYVAISNRIKRGLYELTSKGKISGASMATLVHNRSKLVKAWESLNPELAALPEDMKESLFSIDYDFDYSLDENGKIIKGKNVKYKLPDLVVNEADITGIVSGDDSDGGSGVFENEISKNSEVDLETIEAESIEYYQKLIDSIKQIFSLFKLKYNTTANEYEQTTNKLFDKYEYYLFMYYFGFIRKKDPKGIDKDRNYTQSEIAELIYQMKIDDGLNPKAPMSQSNVSLRGKDIIEKINDETKIRPELRQGLLYLFDYWKSHSDILSDLSSKRELYNIKLDNDRLEDYLSEHPQQKEDYKKTSMGAFIIDDIDESPLLPAEIQHSINELFWLKDQKPKPL